MNSDSDEFDFDYVQSKTPLHRIFQSENFDSLLQDIANVNIQDDSGDTPLHTNRSVENCRILIAHGADVKMTNINGATPLHCALTSEMCQILIEHGAPVNARDKFGSTPLHKACLSLHPDVAYALLYHGANTRIVDHCGRIALAHIGPEDPVLVEVLFNLTYDHHEEPIYWCSFVNVQSRLSPDIFERLVKVCSRVKFRTKLERYELLRDLLEFQPDNLRVFLAKFRETVLDTLALVVAWRKFYNERNSFDVPKDLVKFETLLGILEEHRILSKLIEVFPVQFQYYCRHWLEPEFALGAITPLILICLSNGVTLPQRILHEIYLIYGDCELFRILMHCDLTESNYEHAILLMPSLIYDLSLYDCPLYVGSTHLYQWIGNAHARIEQVHRCLSASSCTLTVLEQFATPRLVQYCRKHEDNLEVIEKLAKMPDVPKLVELARNQARKHIIRKMKIGSSSQLHTFLKHRLHIAQYYKDVLTFKVKLYPN